MASLFRGREIITLPSVSGFAKLNRSLWREAAEAPLAMEEAETILRILIEREKSD